MSVRIKIAKTDKELKDVYWVRHEVYRIEEGYFKDLELDTPHLNDHFDSLPSTANIIAYVDGEPVGTLRTNHDSEHGLPAEESFDFTAFRENVNQESLTQLGQPALICSAGMLAVRKPWRHRRDVILAMFKMAAGIGKAWNCTHIIATVNAKTAAMYRRVKFQPISEQIWVDDIGEHIIPMCSSFAPYYEWAFGDLLNEDKTFLGFFTGQLQRLLLGPGEILFEQGDSGNEAYVIDAGTIRIAVTKDGNEQVLATVGRGELLGEMALLDDLPRSARAEALTNTELLTLTKEDFVSDIVAKPERALDILKRLSLRLRRTSELASILSTGDVNQRLRHALSDIKQIAHADVKSSQQPTVRIGTLDLARQASATIDETISFLDELIKQGEIVSYSNHSIHFSESLLSDAQSH